MAGPVEAELTSENGASIAPLDILWELGGDMPTLVARFVVPDIARDAAKMTYDDASPIMDMLCDRIAVPAILNTESTIEQILVVLMDRPVPRGQAMPDATQFINIYSIENDRCIWEDF